MLTHVYIEHFAVVDKLALNFERGLSVLTGETGAGKSILIDALSLIIGARAQPSYIRPHAQKAEITAVFELSKHPHALEWLKNHGLEAEGECIIRRSVNRDGRSRAFINGRVVPATQLKQFSAYLLDIHGQHQHQSLLDPDHQRSLVDEYAGNEALLSQIDGAYQHYCRLQDERKQLLKAEANADKQALLEYQLEELVNLDLKIDEITTLEHQHDTLAKAEALIVTCHEVINLLQNDEQGHLLDSINKASQRLSPYLNISSALTQAHELLTTAHIQLEEACREIDAVAETTELDPSQLAQLDARLSSIHQLARKHRIKPEALYDYQSELTEQADKLKQAHQRLASIDQELHLAQLNYFEIATRLSQARQKAALSLSRKMMTMMQELEMPKGHFEIVFEPQPQPSVKPKGIDAIEFFVSTNPGLPAQALRKIASGGELSRISLGLEVITLNDSNRAPTLIFDEVDVGISGKTAETVGRLLQRLGAHLQILCVTHLPQVAAFGHHHYKVVKHQTQELTRTEITQLDSKNRLDELARLLGGAKITPQAKANAKSMLAESS